MKPQTILIVDDDKAIAESTEIYLKQEGYHTLIASNGLKALEIIQTQSVGLILLDIMMPQMDGITATMELRKSRNIPIILLSAKSEEADKILGLTVGADDYITKPYSPPELIARVKSALRRYTMLGAVTSGVGVLSPDVIVIGGLHFDAKKKRVEVDGVEVKLTAMEYKILHLLCRHPNQVFSTEEIYRNVWEEDVFVNDNTIAVHVRRIREKIEINPKKPEYLKVVWGLGYKIEGR